MSLTETTTMPLRIDGLAELYQQTDFLSQGWTARFGDVPLNLEIGCGYGHFLSWLAPRHPEQAFIGLDIVTKVLKRAEAKCRQSGAQNLMLAKLDALFVMRELIPPARLDHLYILFPDPWFKERHQRRRTLREDTLPLYASRIRPEGRLLFVSDDPPYAEDARRLLEASPYFEQTDFPEISVRTKYENKWLEQNKTITRLAYRRLDHPDLPQSGNWQGYAQQIKRQLSLPETTINDLQQMEWPYVFEAKNMTIKVQHVFQGIRSQDLLMQWVIAVPNTMAQKTWAVLNTAGELSIPDFEAFPYLASRETVLDAMQASLESRLNV